MSAVKISPATDEEEEEQHSATKNHDASQHQQQNVSTLAMEEMDSPISRKRASPWVVGLILAVTIFGFTAQTEATAYYQDVLGWPKPFCSLYLTHSCLTLPWLFYQLFFQRLRVDQKDQPWIQRQLNLVADLAVSTDAYRMSGHDRPHSKAAALQYLLRTMAVLTLVLTVSGVSWFTALAWTTPSDLTVIYNCSAFFAAVFSVPLLHERLSRYTILAVVLSFAGTLMIAYGGDGPTPAAGTDASKIGTSRVFGNIVAMVGACAYGLYCVLFKKWTFSSQRNDTRSTLQLTFAASGLTGLYTLTTFWIVLIALDLLGMETLEIPSLQVCFYLFVGVIPGSVAMTFVLLLTAWTNPVFGSVASILCVFFVAMADWLLFSIGPALSTYLGGIMIFFAFGLLSWDESLK